jgi:hypothetical protein
MVTATTRLFILLKRHTPPGGGVKKCVFAADAYGRSIKIIVTQLLLLETTGYEHHKI